MKRILESARYVVLIAVISLLVAAIGTFLWGALGLHELFIQKLALPEWLVIDDLKKLKGKLSDVVILILAIKFLEKLIESKNAQDTLMTGIAVAVVIGGLVLFNYTSSKGAD